MVRSLHWNRGTMQKIEHALDDIFVLSIADQEFLNQLEFKHKNKDPDFSDFDGIEAHHPEHGKVGEMYWQQKEVVKPAFDHWMTGEHFPAQMIHPKGEVRNVVVEPEYQRKGVATAMWNHVKENYEPHLQHSTNQSPEGKGWAPSVGANHV